MSILTGLLGEFLPYIVGAISVIGALFFARRSGVKAERAKQVEKTHEAQKKMDAVKPSSEKEAVDKLRSGGL